MAITRHLRHVESKNKIIRFTVSKFEHPDNNYTLQVKQLIEEVYPKDDRLDSVYSDARQYFAEASAQQSALEELQKQLTRAEQQKKGQVKAELLRKQIKELSFLHGNLIIDYKKSSLSHSVQSLEMRLTSSKQNH